jgi:nucleoside-diphosphate-sugar epimerase
VKVSILGCGWFGSALAKLLLSKGMSVSGSTTSADQLNDARTHLVKLETETDSRFDPDFFDCEALVVANNVRMNDGPAYLTRIRFTIELIERFKISRVIFISSTSVYGEPNTQVDENTRPIPETLSAKLLLQAEQLFQSAPFACTIIRLGGLIGPGREPGRFFAEKTNISNGLTPVNLVHLTDAIGITDWVIDTGIKDQVINAVSPDHPSRMDFYTAAARRIGAALPDFVAEKQRWKIVSSIYDTYQYEVGL